MAHPLLTSVEALDFLTAEREIGLSAHERTFVEKNRAYHDGDHWQKGEGYIGPRPAEDESGNSQILWALLERAFLSKNVVKEIDDRLTNAITGQQPDFNVTVRRSRKKVKKQIPDPAFVPPPDDPQAAAPMIDDPKGLLIDEPLTTAEEDKIAEAEAALLVFWDKKKPLKALAGLLERRLWGGRSYLSQFVPPKFRDATGAVRPAKDFNEAILRLFIREPDICDAVKLIDPVLMDELTLIRYERGREKVIELSFVDDDGLTFVGTLTADAEKIAAQKAAGAASGQIVAPTEVGFGADNNAAASDRPAEGSGEPQKPAALRDVDLSDPLPLNGHLTTFELSGKPFITPQILSGNALVNLALTMAGHVLVEAGFSELALTNVELETVRVPDANAPDGSGFREVPKALKRGGTVVHNFVGVQSIGKDGATVYATPGVHKFDPTPLTVFKDGKELGYRNCLEEAHQLHALISGDAAPSGESRIQALADFVMNAFPFKAEIDDAGVWICETALAWAAILAGKPGYFNDLRVNFDCKIYVGKVTPEERAQIISEVNAKLRSKTTARVLIGIDDPAAEQSLIDDEEKSATPPALAQPGQPGQPPRPGEPPTNNPPRPGAPPMPPPAPPGQGRTGANA